MRYAEDGVWRSLDGWVPHTANLPARIFQGLEKSFGFLSGDETEPHREAPEISHGAFLER